MNPYIRKLSVFLCIILSITFCFTAFAKKEAPLYEIYGYQESFEYNDVMIGHALKTTVPKVFLFFEAELSYKPAKFDSDKLSEDFEDLCRRLSDEYTETEIAKALLQYMRENIDRYITYAKAQTVDASAVGTGSGVVISEDGYIATNAHVASLNEQDKLNLYMSSLSQEIMSDLEGVVKDIESYGVSLSESELVEIRDILLEAASEDAEVQKEETTLAVCFPTADGDTTYDENSISYEAEIVEIGTQDSKDGLTQDTAILKIKAENLVALPLSETYPESNSQIVSAGFPAVAEEIFSSAGSDASTLSVSVVTGKVARTIDIEGSDYKSIEITTTISNGSSGGPSVDNHLDIEGLNTYMSSSDNRYAYMVPAAFVSDITKKIDLEREETTKTFLTGLQMLQQNYGKSATECFEYVKEAQPDTPYIENLIETAENAPQNEYKKAIPNESPLDFLLKKSTLLIIGGVLLFIILTALIIVLIVVSSKKKRKKAAYAHSYAEVGYIPKPDYPPIQNLPVFYEEQPVIQPSSLAQEELPIVNVPYSEAEKTVYNAEATVNDSAVNEAVFEAVSQVNTQAITEAYAPPAEECTTPVAPSVIGEPAEEVPAKSFEEYATVESPQEKEQPAEDAPLLSAEEPTSAPSASRLKSTMGKAIPKKPISSLGKDSYFSAPEDL